MTDAANTNTPGRLSLHHQALANLLGVVTVQVLHDQRYADVMTLLAQALPAARTNVPRAFAPVVEEAETLLNVWPRCRKTGSGMDWVSAMIQAQAALSGFFLQRALAALNAAEPQPEPELAHAQS